MDPYRTSAGMSPNVSTPFEFLNQIHEFEISSLEIDDNGILVRLFAWIKKENEITSLGHIFLYAPLGDAGKLQKLLKEKKES